MTSLRCLFCKLWTYFTPFSSVSVINFKHVFVCWKNAVIKGLRGLRYWGIPKRHSVQYGLTFLSVSHDWKIMKLSNLSNNNRVKNGIWRRFFRCIFLLFLVSFTTVATLTFDSIQLTDITKERTNSRCKASSPMRSSSAVPFQISVIPSNIVLFSMSVFNHGAFCKNIYGLSVNYFLRKGYRRCLTL